MDEGVLLPWRGFREFHTHSHCWRRGAYRQHGGCLDQPVPEDEKRGAWGGGRDLREVDVKKEDEGAGEKRTSMKAWMRRWRMTGQNLMGTGFLGKEVDAGETIDEPSRRH